MNVNRTNCVLLALLAAVVFAMIVFARQQPAEAQGGGPMPAVRYSVSESQGHNLIVADNKTNTLYFYTIDKDKEIGSELKLRASIDLSQVGSPSIKPMVAK
jgi:hypothetical protein